MSPATASVNTSTAQSEAGLQGARVGDSFPGGKGEKNVSGVTGKVSGEREGAEGGLGYGPIVGHRKPYCREREASGEITQRQLPQPTQEGDVENVTVGGSR